MDISVLGPAEGALRDPRYFSSTNNLRLVKNISAPANSQLLWRNMKIKKTHIWLIYLSFIRFTVTFSCFYGYQCFGSSRRCSAGSKKNFLDKQSETCQKNFHLRQTHSSYEETWKSKNLTFDCISPILWYFMIFSDDFMGTGVLDSSRRCSAGSKKNCLDKQSETCQKSFELQQLLSSYEETWKS